MKNELPSSEYVTCLVLMAISFMVQMYLANWLDKTYLKTVDKSFQFFYKNFDCRFIQSEEVKD